LPETQGPPPPIQANNVEPELRSATSERIAQLEAPAGFQIDDFGVGLGSVRMMAQAEDGTVYVTRRQQGDVLALRDENNDGRADEPLVVASDLELVHGIIIDGDQIYLATPTTIYGGTLGEEGDIQDLTALVNNLPEAGQHGNRTMAFGPDGLLYVSVGSPCNACSIVNPEYAAILQMQPDGSSRTLLAEGLRNIIGWSWHPETGEMWGMDHGSDWRGDDQPPEELNLLAQGSNYGWPYCFADKQVDPYLPGSPPALTKAEFCAESVGPVLTYQAHSAPIGMVFYTGDQFPEMYQNDAFIAMRGSWNRQEPVGYKVVRLDFDEDGQPVAFEDFVTGWLIEEGTAQFGRVAGLLALQDGSLLISEDTNGMIYRVSYTGEE
jgi:glucose/arabinose dehydrogenase